VKPERSPGGETSPSDQRGNAAKKKNEKEEEEGQAPYRRQRMGGGRGSRVDVLGAMSLVKT